MRPRPRRRRSGALQFNWEAARDLQLYWGARYGDARGEGGAHRERTEVYLKLSRTLRGG